MSISAQMVAKRQQKDEHSLAKYFGRKKAYDGHFWTRLDTVPRRDQHCTPVTSNSFQPTLK